MEQKNNLIIVSGPAASGKTTLVKQLENCYMAYFAKPSECYLEIARRRGIPAEHAFSEVSREDAEELYCQICKSHRWVIGDQHLAIQYHRDSAMAVTNEIDSNAMEEYVPAISKDFIEKLKKAGINPFVILLEGKPEVLLERAIRREKKIGHTVRNKSIEEVTREVEAERRCFDQLVRETQIPNIAIDVTNRSQQEVYLYALQRIHELTGKSHDATEWTR